MKFLFLFQICLLNQLYSKQILHGKQGICSTLPLLEILEDCDANDSISNYKILSPAKKGNKSLNGQIKILFNECSISDTLKTKRCIKIKI